MRVAFLFDLTAAESPAASGSALANNIFANGFLSPPSASLTVAIYCFIA